MAPMPPAWLAVEDEESGAMYFYHERTGRTTWEHPADRCALQSLAQAHSLLSRKGLSLRMIRLLRSECVDQTTRGCELSFA